MTINLQLFLRSSSIIGLSLLPIMTASTFGNEHATTPIATPLSEEHSKPTHKEYHNPSKRPIMGENDRFETQKNRMIKELNDLISSLKTQIETIKNENKIPSTAIEEANLKLSEGEKWVQILESYKDPRTHLARTYHFAKNELMSIKHTIHPSHYYARLRHRLEYLTHEIDQIKDHIPFEAENKLFVSRILENAKNYLIFAASKSSQKEMHVLADRADFLLKTAKKFIKMHNKQKYVDPLHQ